MTERIPTIQRLFPVRQGFQKLALSKQFSSIHQFYKDFINDYYSIVQKKMEEEERYDDKSIDLSQYSDITRPSNYK